MEHKQLYKILLKHKITGYFRYADDILTVYNQKQTNTDKTIIEFNKQNNNIEFKVEKEHHNSINFLDLTIHRRNKTVEFEIYRKPTHTDIIIPIDSCHPCEHKISAIKYLINRVNTYPITEEAKKSEIATIHNILRNNKYDTKYNTPKTTETRRKYRYTTIKCMSCPMKYTGQTGRPFNTRYKAHIRDIQIRNSNSGYSNQILNTGHSYGSHNRHNGNHEN
jgi:DNA-directed RNA polymerase subunit L